MVVWVSLYHINNHTIQYGTPARSLENTDLCIDKLYQMQLLTAVKSVQKTSYLFHHHFRTITWCISGQKSHSPPANHHASHF